MTNHISDTLTNRVLQLAHGALGVPYVAQAAHLTAGCDCLGFVYAVLTQAGVSGLPPLEQLRIAAPPWTWQTPAARQPGDVLLLQWLGGQHVGIAAHDNAIIHACVKRGVCLEPLNMAWQQRLRGVWRVGLICHYL